MVTEWGKKGNMAEQSRALMLKDFGFDVPEYLVAQEPLKKRDDARLLIYRPNHVFAHNYVKNLSDVVPNGALFILNDSRVIASRMIGKIATGAKIEIFLIEPQVCDGREYWRCLGKPMKKLSADTVVSFGDGLNVRVVNDPEHSDSGPQPFLIDPSLKGTELLNWLQRNGEMPLPPYISRKTQTDEVRAMDRDRYQTVYAQGEGSVAAPTAGLHFTNDVIESLKSKQCTFEFVTLHVGAGTFLPVKSDDPANHIMHEERFLVPLRTLKAIQRAKQEGRPVIVVGTTAFRSLEGLYQASHVSKQELETLAEQWQRTSIFIRPTKASDRYTPWCADVLMTNFHQPESSLFMMVCSLIGYENARSLYDHAIKEKFRFFSYGDSSLLWLKQ
jgi:S-adenosylmethionine:tRNA ribosyltransferase-isomerase